MGFDPMWNHDTVPTLIHNNPKLFFQIQISSEPEVIVAVIAKLQWDKSWY